MQMQSAVADATLSLRILKVGGILIVDDMSWPGVERAMAAAVKAFGGENRLEVLSNKVRITFSMSLWFTEEQLSRYALSLGCGNTEPLVQANYGISLFQAGSHFIRYSGMRDTAITRVFYPAGEGISLFSF